MSSGVLIAGPLGVGKTSVAIAVGDILHERGAGAAIVDLDWLGWLIGSSVSINEVIAKNLAAIWPNLRAAGAEYLILTRALENRSDAETFRAAVPDVSLVIAHVTAPLDVIHARLRRRDAGATLQEHLVQSAEMGDLERQSDDIYISNGDTPVEDTAARLLDELGWL
ncbi:MAG: hypothetical protein M3290_06050 [Actinomycetota bacterium]|nr:hypothetical protein [Actinomycetota bacterium]